MSAKSGCRKRVYEPGSMAGFPCSRAAVVPPDAPLWCSQHSPDATAKRNAKSTARWEAQWGEQQAAEEKRSQREAARDRRAALCEEALALLRRMADWLFVEAMVAEAGGKASPDAPGYRDAVRALLDRADREAGG